MAQSADWSKAMSPHFIKHIIEDTLGFLPYEKYITSMSEQKKSYVIPAGIKFIFCRPNMGTGSYKWDMQIAYVDHLFTAKEYIRIEDGYYVFSRFQSLIYVKIEEVRIING
jgi:hypothetical protein